MLPQWQRWLSFEFQRLRSEELWKRSVGSHFQNRESLRHVLSLMWPSMHFVTVALRQLLFVVVDATYIKVRENHRIVSKALLVAIGLTDGRSKVIGIFPNVSSAIRLMGAFLMEENERWKANRKIYYAPACKELKAKIPTLAKIARNQIELRKVA